MSAPDISRSDVPVGPLRNIIRGISITAEDYENPAGVLVQANQAGDIVVRCLEGDADETFTMTAGGIVGMGTFPVLCKAVRTNATVTTIDVGRL